MPVFTMVRTIAVPYWIRQALFYRKPFLYCKMNHIQLEIEKVSLRISYSVKRRGDFLEPIQGFWGYISLGGRFLQTTSRVKTVENAAVFFRMHEMHSIEHLSYLNARQNNPLLRQVR